MCAHEDHLKIKCDNEQFIKFIEGKRDAAERYNDWVGIVIFYCIVHLIESEFAKFNVHSESHAERLDNLQALAGNVNETLFRPFIKAYRHIKNDSNRYRYDGLIPTQEDIEDLKLKANDIDRLTPKVFANQTVYS